MKETKLVLHFPYGKPFKKNEKEKLMNDVISSFKAVGISDAKVEDSYYISERAVTGVVTLVLVILTAAANIATLAMAIREFLKDHKDIKDMRLKTESLQLTVKGNMSDEAIIKLVKEARKTIETEREE